jgi:Uma2 family endonuclease
MTADAHANLDSVGGAPKRATYQDVLDAPENVVAELIGGVLHTHARPRRRHAAFATGLGALLYAEYQERLGRRGGWVVVFEPELHLADDVLVPDVAAWRLERYDTDHDHDATGHTVAPDWVCEVLSPSTARIDRVVKLPIYARAGVSWAWLADPIQRTLEVYRRAAPLW